MRKIRKLLVGGVLVYVVVVFYLGSSTFGISFRRDHPLLLSNTTRIVVAWTPIFGDWQFWYPPGLGYRPFQNDLCHYDDCYLTTDKYYYQVASVLLFHCRDYFSFWPRVRRPDQLYGVVCHESPSNSDLSSYRDNINMTITYRRHSDIFFPQCWFERLSKRSQTPYKSAIKLTDRTHSVVWPVSNCQTASRRELYAKQLQKYIDVDVYGGCGALRCPRSEGQQCTRYFARNYKFYLSFENSICKDYVSEKFFTPLEYDIVPVVLGGESYDMFPEHSYINVDDFRSPKHLAAYLKYLANNESAYSEYFQWRLQYRLRCENKDKLYCDLCRMIHEGYKNHYRDVGKWWAKDTCNNSKISQLLE